jgi:hypothetical protein
MKKRVNEEVTAMFNNRNTASSIITDDDLKGLPVPVQRYLRYCRVVGRPRIQAVRLKQTGVFRQKPDGKWGNLEAEQYYTVNPPAFLWTARLESSPLVWVTGRDFYSRGKGNMLIRLFSTITVADARGPELDQGAMTRYLSEIVWFPTAWLSKYIHWEAVDSSSAKVTMEYRGVSASALVSFNEKGELVNLVAERYRMDGGAYSLDTWATPGGEYREFDGMMIPTRGEAVWKLKSGDYSYIKIEITSVEYDKPLQY